ncbi:inositol 1,4,5-trisphosphate receptor-interacting protein-like 1 [Anser cygnoides]|uniref:Mab-21-like HhH/H2TH-like domain-containing protein n=1 Tax=Anser cygnoides TaxID=8845 RepID=A0A8B9EM43_ANSCY
MASALFFVLTFLGFGPQKVGDELDADANEHIQQRVEMLQERMMQLLWEIEKRDREHHRRDAMQAVLLSVLLRWQFWFSIGVLVLFFWYLWRILRRIREPDSSSEEESSSDEEDSSSGEEEEESSSSEEEEEEQQRPQPNPNDANDLADYVSQRIYWPLPNPTIRCYQVAEVVEDLLNAYSSIFQESFFPELQSAIGVGSAFEGWSPRENDTVYRLLVPMTAPRGHSFHLELGKEDDILARNSSIRVELECTCAREQAFEDMLCFLHHSEDELKNQEPSLLDTLCTDSYLDAEKTARWFQNFVKTAWVVMPQSHLYNVKVLPSARSCKFQMTNATKRNLTIEIIFGVQQGNSDIFLSSQRTEAIITPSTTWPQSCAVAERKFFQHINAEAWFYSLHLKCMQICARMLVGTSISTYVIKTVVMHLLTSVPLETWHREDFLLRLDDIIRYLHCCLEEKRLNHFFFGNEMVPDVIALPPAFQLSGPVNLFEHLEQDTRAYTHMLEEFQELRNRLTRLMIYGH